MALLGKRDRFIAIKNAGVVSLMLAAAYLSLCAVVGLSIITTDLPNSEASSQKLREKLETFSISRAEFDSLFPKAFTYTDPFKELDSEAERLRKSQAAEPKASEQNVPANLTIAEDVDLGFANLLTDLATYQDNLFSTQTTLADRAIAFYDASNLDRKGAREQDALFLGMIKWYDGAVRGLEEHLTLCRADVSRAYSALKLQSGNLKSATTGATGDKALSELDGLLNSIANDPRRACFSGLVLPQMPTRARLGSSSRILQFFGWLLATESESLVLITGLLGFGVLGALGSSSIRHFNDRREDGLLISQITPVIIRGASAAVLVFLASYAGLAVLGKNGGSPNPYAVLFACLVASVYSEDTWAWALQRFKQQSVSASSGNSQLDKSKHLNGKRPNPL